MLMTKLALRHMTPTAFGTLMALEPAIAVLLGLLVLHQKLSATQIAGILLVVLAGTAAQRNGRRHPPAAEHVSAHPEPDFKTNVLSEVWLEALASKLGIDVDKVHATGKASSHPESA